MTTPDACNRPVTEWSARELTDEIHQRNIAGISVRQVGRFLLEADLKPHKSDYWMNPKIDDQSEHDKHVDQINITYQNAPGLKENGTYTISIDEKTGIQALERIAEDRPMLPGFPRKLEYEYKRHGTLCLIPGFDVVTGLAAAQVPRGPSQGLAGGYGGRDRGASPAPDGTAGRPRSS